MKKLLGLLACLLLALGIVPKTALAAGEVVEVTGEHTRESLAEIFSNAPEGAVVTFRNDVTYEVDGLISITKPLTIDLGGHTLTGQGGSMLDIYSDVTITNGTIALEGASSNAAVWLNQTAKLTVAANTHFSVTGSPENAASAAINFYNDCAGAVLDFSGSIDGDMGLSVNGNITVDNTVIIRDGAKITARTTGLYQAGFATTTIGKAEITGATGIEVRAGNVTLNGTQITATSDFEEVPNRGGTTISGAALAVSQHTTNQPINVTINDATLTGAKAFYEVDLQDTEGIEDVVLNVAGGHYDGEVASQNHTGFVNAGVFTTKPEADLIAPAKTEAMLTSGGEVTYFIGEPAYVAGEVEAVAKSGDTIEVTQGDLTLEDLPGDITVKNTGDGEVLANHVAATAEGIVTVAPAEITDSEGVSPQTGDLNLVAVLALMAGALLSFAAAYRSQKARA